MGMKKSKIPIIGIYKITSPTGRIYIGQSSDILRRFATYKILRCKSQPKLYLSLQKYGVAAHSFEILEQCDEQRLNELETFYLNHYQSFTADHLNCRVDGLYQIASEETRRKISLAHKGRIVSDETRQKLRQAFAGKPSPKRGIKVPRESVEKQRRALIGQMAGEKNPFFGKKHCEATLQKMRGKKKGVGGNNIKARMVINLETGIFYDCMKDASHTTNFRQEHFRAMLNGKRKNKTSFIQL
jgi:group I intron endonuclease